MHWRETMRPPRFFGLDGRAAVLLLVFGVHPSTWTALIVVILIGILVWNERQGLTVPSAFRVLRRKLGAVIHNANPFVWLNWRRPRGFIPWSHRPIAPLTRRRRWTDAWPSELKLIERRLQKLQAAEAAAAAKAAKAAAKGSKGAKGAKPAEARAKGGAVKAGAGGAVKAGAGGTIKAGAGGTIKAGAGGTIKADPLAVKGSRRAASGPESENAQAAQGPVAKKSRPA